MSFTAGDSCGWRSRSFRRRDLHMSNWQHDGGRRPAHEAGFTTTEMVAALIAMSLVVVGLMAAARNYARALEALTTATALRAAAPTFERQVTAFAGDLDRTANRTPLLKCGPRRLEGRCRDADGGVAACTLAITQSDLGWSIRQSGGRARPPVATRSLKITELRFACALSDEGASENRVAAVFVEKKTGATDFSPWIAAPM